MSDFLKSIGGFFGRGKSDQPVASTRPPAILINLDRDKDRLDRVTAELAGQKIALTRLPAVLGSAVTPEQIAHLEGAAAVPPGTLGCFLSHIQAWEMIVEMDGPGAIVLEDDIRILRNLADCYDIAVASGHDLVFMNSRMAPPKSQQSKGGELIGLIEVIISRTGEKGTACGTDGYFISAAGARTMLDLVRSQGLKVDVDWALLLASLGADDIPKIAGNEVFAGILRYISTLYYLPSTIIDGRALRRPAVRHGGMGSTRLELNGKR